jgi:outer membrane protein TolC
MRTASNPDSQRRNQRDYLSFPAISAFLPAVIGILIAIFGTAWTFTFALKPQQAAKATTSSKTVLKSHIAQPRLPKPLTKTLQQSRQPTNKSEDSPRWVAESRRRQEAEEANTEIRGLEQFSRPISERFFVSLLRKALTDRKVVSSSAIAPSSHSVDSQTLCNLTLFSPIAVPSAQPLEHQLTRTPTQYIAQFSARQQTQPITVTNSTISQSLSVSEAQAVRLTLSDIVFLVVENNRLIKNAYLERIAQQQELRVAEDKFVPDFTPSVSLSVAQFESNQTTTDADLGLGATVSVKVSTGGELSFRWATNGQTVSQNGLDLNINDNPFAQNLELSFRQPLLRGYGVEVNRASVDIARLTEQVNILDLKSTLINTITEVIVAYRELIRAQERLKIAQLSLARAQESLANNRILIEAGRLAPVDIVQSETDVARRQVSLIEAENNLASARLALLNILDIDKTTVIVASDPLTIPAVTLNPDKLRAIALENQPDYLKAQLDLERTQLALLQAENNRRWDLNLNTSYGYASDETSDLRVGLGLSRKIGDLTVERDFKRSLVNKLKAENTLKEQRETLDLQLMDRIRDVNLSFAQVELAKKVTESSERQLEIAREKQRLGREITVFELIGLQDELVQARMIELNAIINYLNALTRLDQTLGTTLDTWQVVVEKNVN